MGFIQTAYPINLGLAEPVFPTFLFLAFFHKNVQDLKFFKKQLAKLEQNGAECFTRLSPALK